MSSNIKANVSVMFSTIEPCNVSGSVAELGPSAARLTWENAMRIAFRHNEWLESNDDDAARDMCDWAVSTGGWTREETDEWNTYQCLALFVQNIASELRMLGIDHDDLIGCVTTYQETDWDNAPEYPVGSYSADSNGDVHVDYYTGV